MTDKLNFLFHPGSGLGDSVVVMPIFHAAHEYLGGIANIDLITHQNIELVQELYYGVPFIGQILPIKAGNETMLLDMSDGMIAGNEFVNVQIKDHALPHMLEFAVCVQEGLERRKKFGIVNQVHTFLNNQLGNFAVLLGLNRCSLSLYSLGMPNYLETATALQLRPGALAVLETYGLAANEFITVQDGWDANFPLNKPNARPTKVWSEAAWIELVAEIRRRHPDKKIIQLGSPKTGSDILGVDLNLRGKTSLRDSLALLKYSALHIDTEGGLVHMARALHTQSVVLFGPTNEKFFGYIRNKNLVPPCNNCWWLTHDWMSDCVRGLEVPECMTHHKPVVVADTVSECLDENKPAHGAATYSAAPAPAPNSRIGVVNNAVLAAEFGAAGHHVTHFDLTAQKNIQKPIAGMQYRQFLARTINLPVENQTLDYLVFTADADAFEFAGELLEALRVLKIGGCCVITTAVQNIALAFTKAKIPVPTSNPTNTLVLTRIV